MVIVFAFYDPILEFLRQPYINLCRRNTELEGQADLFSLGPLEGFNTRLRVSLYGGVVLALPVLLWQIWRFIVPALHAKEKRYAVPFILSSVVLFALGGYIAYWTLDKALEFLIGYSGQDVQQTYQVAKYISLVGLMVAAFGVGFEFPVLLVFLQLVGVLTPQTLLRGWRYALMIIFVIAAVITPSGDPISMLALAVPMSIFYLISIVIGVIFQRRKRAAEASA
jgi:sec-independent protein translocase protein TatC